MRLWSVEYQRTDNNMKGCLWVSVDESKSMARADLLPETVRFKPHATANPIPPTLKHRGRPPKNGGADHPHG